MTGGLGMWGAPGCDCDGTFTSPPLFPCEDLGSVATVAAGASHPCSFHFPQGLCDREAEAEAEARARCGYHI